FSDIHYVSGREGTQFVEANGPGYGSAADYPEAPRGGGGRGARGAAAAAATAPRGGTNAAPAPPAGGGGGGGGLQVQGLSIVKPPYGVLSAIDMNKGDLLWSVPHGDTPDNVRNHPVVGPILADYLKKNNLPKTGQQGTVGNIVTKTLVILGDP